MADAALETKRQEAAPLQYVIPGAQEIVIKAARASFDGSGAGSPFVPTLRILAPDGAELAACPIGSQVAAGASADVTWFPRGGVSSGTGAGDGLQFTANGVYGPNNQGDSLAVETNGPTPDPIGGVGMTLVDASGLGQLYWVFAGGDLTIRNDVANIVLVAALGDVDVTAAAGDVTVNAAKETLTLRAGSSAVGGTKGLVDIYAVHDHGGNRGLVQVGFTDPNDFQFAKDSSGFGGYFAAYIGHAGPALSDATTPGGQIIDTEGVGIEIGDGGHDNGTTVRLRAGGGFGFMTWEFDAITPNLPTLPGASGTLWNNAGVVSVAP